MKALTTLTVLFLYVATFTSCKKETLSTTIETSTVVDIDGNSYKTVKLGDDWWMAENLKVTKFNDGKAITLVLNSDVDTVWSKKTAAAYCVPDKRFGAYYNVYAIENNSQLAPEGWHVASDEDWKNLEMALGMTEQQANQTGWRGDNIVAKLLPKDSNGWLTGEGYVFGNDSCEMNMLPGGCKLFDGREGDIAVSGYWWSPTSTTVASSTNYYRNITSAKSSIFRYKADKRYGFPVRCVKNK